MDQLDSETNSFWYLVYFLESLEKLEKLRKILNYLGLMGYKWKKHILKQLKPKREIYLFI